MKRYETMTKDEIMNTINTPHELPDNYTGTCYGCPVWDWEMEHGCHHRCSCERKNYICADNVREFLNEELEMKPRWQTAKTDADIAKMITEWSQEIPSNGLDSLIDFMCEKVEVNEKNSSN